MLRLLPFFYWVSRVGVDGLGFLGPLISVLHAKCINHFGGAQKTSGKMEKWTKTRDIPTAAIAIWSAATSLTFLLPEKIEFFLYLLAALVAFFLLLFVC